MKNIKPDEHCCISQAVSRARVSVNLDLTPVARIGDITTRCCGAPVVNREETPCGCRLSITQNLSITVPIEYDACVSGEEVLVECSDR